MAGLMQEFSASAAQWAMNICFGERSWCLTLVLDTGLWYIFYCSVLKRKVMLWRNEQTNYFPRAYNKSTSWCGKCVYFPTQFETLALSWKSPKLAWDFLCPYALELLDGLGQWEHQQCNISCLKTQTPASWNSSVKGSQVCSLIPSLINRGAKYQHPFRGVKYQHPLVINAGKKGSLAQY